MEPDSRGILSIFFLFSPSLGYWKHLNNPRCKFSHAFLSFHFPSLLGSSQEPASGSSSTTSSMVQNQGPGMHTSSEHCHTSGMNGHSAQSHSAWSHSAWHFESTCAAWLLSVLILRWWCHRWAELMTSLLQMSPDPALKLLGGSPSGCKVTAG